MATKQGTKAAAAADQEFDPKFEWMEYPTNYVLRVSLSGFKKENFKVQVDGEGRLTVRGQRPTGAGADSKLVRFHKVFQLPSTANLDEISGRFHDNVLTLTVPKRPATAPTTIQEIKKPPMPKEEDAKPKDDEAAQKTTDTMPPKEEDAKPKEEIPKKALDDASKVQHKEEEEEADKKRKQEQEQEPTPAVRKEEVMKPKTEATAATTENQAKPEAAGERAKSFDRESLVERTRRRAEDDRAKAAAAAEEAEREKKTACGGWKERVAGELEELADMKWADRRRAEDDRAKAAAAAEEAEREKKTACGGWKERVVGELEELADMKWADDLVEMARKNKEVIAAAVAAFSLGFFVSQKLFSRK